MFEEIRIWVHVAIGVTLVAIVAGTTWKLTADSYRGEILQAERSQYQAVQTQTDRALAAERMQHAAEDAVQVEHEQHLKDSSELSGRLADSLRDLERTRARLGSLSGAVADPGQPAGAAAGAGSAAAVAEIGRRIEEATRRFDRARDNAIAACGHDSVELGDILNLQTRREQPAEVGETK